MLDVSAMQILWGENRAPQQFSHCISAELKAHYIQYFSKLQALSDNGQMPNYSAQQLLLRMQRKDNYAIEIYVGFDFVAESNRIWSHISYFIFHLGFSSS